MYNEGKTAQDWNFSSGAVIAGMTGNPQFVIRPCQAWQAEYSAAPSARCKGDRMGCLHHVWVDMMQLYIAASSDDMPNYL